MGTMWDEVIAAWDREEYDVVEQTCLKEEGDEEHIELRWAALLEDLAKRYQYHDQLDRVQKLYLNIIMWNESMQAFQESSCSSYNLAQSLFSQVQSFTSVQDARHFLATVKSDSRYAIEPTISMLALTAPIASRAAIALWSLCRYAPNRPIIVQKGGVNMLLKSLSYHSLDTAGEDCVVHAAGSWGALRLLIDQPGVAEQILNEDGVEMLYRCVMMHREPDLYRKCLLALSLLKPEGQIPPSTHHNLVQICVDACAMDVPVQIAAAKGMRVLVGHCSMEALIGSVDMLCDDVTRAVHEPIGYMMVLSIMLESKNVREYCNQIAASTAAKVMHLYMDSPSVLTHACTCMGLLCLEPEGIAHLSAMGIITLLCTILHEYHKNKRLLGEVMKPLKRIIAHDEVNKVMLVKCDGVREILGALRAHMGNPEMTIDCLDAMRYCCDCVGRAFLGARLGVIETTVKTLIRHPNHLGVVAAASNLLMFLADEPSLKIRACKTAMPKLAMALNRHTNAGIQFWGNELIHMLEAEPNFQRYFPQHEVFQ